MLQALRLCLLLCAGALTANAQTDTIRIAAYNLLNYGNSANPVTYKNRRLKPILQEIRPAIQCFNEVSTAVPGLLDTLLAVMPLPMEHGGVHNTTGTTQLDALYWKQGVFHLLRDSIICNTTRDIVAYDLYWDYPGLSTYQDTLKLTVITAHFKSSNGASDRTARAAETQQVSAYLSTLREPANVVLLGDLNLYSSSEVAYQNLTAPAYANARLNDPLNRPGAWDNNSFFADIHTQSPRLAALSDGGASSGLDSRFDFVLVSDPVLTGAKGMKYVPGSYKAFGNDGQHYGKALTDLPANGAVSPSTAQALYECSDHLPVFADFVFTPPHQIPTSIAKQEPSLETSIRVENPVGSTIHIFRGSAFIDAPLHYALYSSSGTLIQSGIIPPSGVQIELGRTVQPGLYLLRLISECGQQALYKIVHQ